MVNCCLADKVVHHCLDWTLPVVYCFCLLLHDVVVHLFERQLLNLDVSVPIGVKSFNGGSHFPHSRPVSFNHGKGLLVREAFVILLMIVEKLVAISQQFNSIVHDVLYDTKMVGASLDVVHAPIVVDLDYLVDATVLNVVHQDVPERVTCVLDLLVIKSPDAFLKHFMSSVMQDGVLGFHPGTKALVIKNMMSWFMEPSLDKVVSGNVMHSSGESEVIHHVCVVSVWAG
jgi:hypothetical protein